MLIVADPTIILVHGAFADASSSSRLHADLAGDELTIKAPPNPLRRVTVEDAEYARCAIEQVEGPVLLVGHRRRRSLTRGYALAPSSRR